MNKSQSLAQRVYGYILAFPEKHEQQSWVGDSDKVRETNNVCDTTLCVAGAAVLLADGVEGVVNRCGFWNGSTFSERGMELLGLTQNEANELFYTTDNSTARKAVKALAEGKRNKFRRIIGLESWQ